MRGYYSFLVLDGNQHKVSNLSVEDCKFINETREVVLMIYRVYPVFLVIVGIPTNLLTMAILCVSPGLRHNFVSSFLLYLSGFNVLNLLIGTSRYLVLGHSEYDFVKYSVILYRLYSVITMVCHMVTNFTLLVLAICKLLYVINSHQMNVLCAGGRPNTIMFILVSAVTAFHLFMTEGGKKIVPEEHSTSTHYEDQEGSMVFSRERAIVQVITFYYVPAISILVVNLGILLLYHRTRSDVGHTSKRLLRHLQTANRFAMITLLCDVEIIIMEFPYAYFFTEEFEWRKEGPVSEAKASLFSSVATMMLYTNFSINFLIYCFFGSQYATTLKWFFRPCLKLVVKPDSSWLDTDEVDSEESSKLSSQIELAVLRKQSVRATASLRSMLHAHEDIRRKTRTKSTMTQVMPPSVTSPTVTSDSTLEDQHWQKVSVPGVEGVLIHTRKSSVDIAV